MDSIFIVKIQIIFFILYLSYFFQAIFLEAHKNVY